MRKTILGSLLLAGATAAAIYWIRRKMSSLIDDLEDDFYKDLWQ